MDDAFESKNASESIDSFTIAKSCVRWQHYSNLC